MKLLLYSFLSGACLDTPSGISCRTWAFSPTQLASSKGLSKSHSKYQPVGLLVYRNPKRPMSSSYRIWVGRCWVNEPCLNGQSNPQIWQEFSSILLDYPNKTLELLIFHSLLKFFYFKNPFCLLCLKIHSSSNITGKSSWYLP